MPAPTYPFLPFDRQLDGGFSAIADAFHEAANRLETETAGAKFLNAALPIAYLRRHAAELFLKSCIIVLHRALSLPFGAVPPTGRPHINRQGTW